MANTRLIRQNFFNDPLIAEKYDIKERYFLIGLACAADDWGRFWLNESNLKSIIFPTDQLVTSEWIVNSLQKFKSDLFLCEYEVDGIEYAHFPRWFEKGWFLKQRIDHPREFASPDCPICETEKKTKKKRESSRAIKSNVFQSNEKESKKIKKKLTEEEISELLTSFAFSIEMLEKYPFIQKSEYTTYVNCYIKWVGTNDGFGRNHKREFEGQLLSANAKIENKNK